MKSHGTNCLSVENEEARRTALGRESDFGLAIPEGLLDEQTTFLFDDQTPAVGDEQPPLETSFEDAMASREQNQGQQEEPELQNPDPMEFNEFSSPANIPFGQEDASNAQPDPIPFHHEAPREEPAKRSNLLQTLKRQRRVSRHGIPYPALPPSFVKKVASTALQSSGLNNHKISPDTLGALVQASEWYFEQLGDDLAAYANHAKRKTIEEADVATLMRR